MSSRTDEAAHEPLSAKGSVAEVGAGDGLGVGAVGRGDTVGAGLVVGDGDGAALGWSSVSVRAASTHELSQLIRQVADGGAACRDSADVDACKDTALSKKTLFFYFAGQVSRSEIKALPADPRSPTTEEEKKAFRLSSLVPHVEKHASSLPPFHTSE